MDNIENKPKVTKRYRIRPLRPDEKGFPFWKDVMDVYYVDENGVEITDDKLIQKVKSDESITNQTNHDNSAG